MSIERIKQIRENVETADKYRDRIEPYEYVEDVSFLLEQNQRLVEELEQIKEALNTGYNSDEIMKKYSRRNDMIEEFKKLNEQYINKLEQSELEFRIGLMQNTGTEHLIELIKEANKESFDAMREAYRTRGLI